MYNASIVAGLLNVQASFSNPNEGSFWILSVIQGALAFAADTVAIGVAALGGDRVRRLRTGLLAGQGRLAVHAEPELARQPGARGRRDPEPGRRSPRTCPTTTSAASFRALSPDHADYFRAALWAAVGTLDVWAGTIASSGVPRDIERAQRMLTASFLLSLHEGMWCQAVSDPTPYAVTLGGACHRQRHLHPDVEPRAARLAGHSEAQHAGAHPADGAHDPRALRGVDDAHGRRAASARAAGRARRRSCRAEAR